MPRLSSRCLRAAQADLGSRSHIRQLSNAHNSPMPVTDVAHQHLITARALHLNDLRDGKAQYETLDWSGIVAGTRVAAGLDGFDSQKV